MMKPCEHGGLDGGTDCHDCYTEANALRDERDRLWTMAEWEQLPLLGFRGHVVRGLLVTHVAGTYGVTRRDRVDASGTIRVAK